MLWLPFLRDITQTKAIEPVKKLFLLNGQWLTEILRRGDSKNRPSLGCGC